MYAKDFLNITAQTQSKGAKDVVKDITKGTLVGTGIGTIAGIVIGFSRGKNVLMAGFIGGVSGAIITRAFINK
jgi:hypothetical protein